MIRDPKIGMAVEFNDRGLKVIGGLESKEQIKAAQNMHITTLEPIPIDNEIAYVIGVNQPSIDMFLFTNHDIDELYKPCLYAIDSIGEDK